MKILVLGWHNMFKGEQDAIKGYYSGKDPEFTQPEHFPVNNQEYLELRQQTEPDEVVLPSGFDMALIREAATSVPHMVLSVTRILTLGEYLELRDRIDTLTAASERK